MSTQIRTARARLAAATRHHPESSHEELRRDLKAANLAEYVRRVVSEAPPLTQEQADRIAGLLRGGAA
ncbi:hypothetical protein NicSoilB11_25930 [Arthrobacter sp. NicSoilB11]|nr:hypothetical protein NicSoilB11_25930 [Arthrobacter sp. NicSoilB11]